MATIREAREIALIEERLDGKISDDGASIEYPEYKQDLTTGEKTFPDGSKQIGTVTTYRDGTTYDEADGKYTFPDGSYIKKDGTMYDKDGIAQTSENFKGGRRLQVNNLAAFCSANAKFCNADATKLLIGSICEN